MLSGTELNGKVAFITGGARGIGRGIALKLAQAGADLAINYLERDDSAYEVSEWIKGLGRRVLLLKGDVSDREQVEAMFEKLTAEYGKLDILVNNVGPFLVNPALATTLPDWKRMIDTNLTSAFLVGKAAADLMTRSEAGGSMIFIGSPNAERIGSQSEACAYSIAKTGVVILALTLARELAGKAVRVNVVNPGFIENDSMTPRMREWMPHEVPLGRIGTPANIGDAVLFLATEQSSYVTGEVLNVHGGLWI